LSESLEIASVLFLRLSSIGDIVLTEPAVAAFHEAYPSAEIGYAVKARFADLVSSHPAISRVHALGEESGALTALTRDVRGVGYSALVDLHRNIRTARIARASGVPLRSHYRKRELPDAIRVRLIKRPFRASRLLVRRYLDALRPLGIDAPVRRPKLYVDSDDAAAADGLLTCAEVAGGRFAAVVPGAVWATKRWPAERFAAVAAGIVSDLGLRVLLLGSETERELCGQVGSMAGEGAVNLAGETTLGQMAAVIARSRVFVGNDSGPMHMSMALGVPTVALFGPTDPRQFDFEGHAVVYRDLPCSACSFYGGESCRLGHWDCMLGVGPDEVLGVVRELLAKGGER
jgi:heptosyltransferase-2